MFKKGLKTISIIALLGIFILYMFPVPVRNIQELHRGEDTKLKSLETFRTYSISKIQDNGKTWEYINIGNGPEAILFLHGMGGSYDIWWQQIEELKNDFSVISLTYPAISTLEGMAEGVLAILNTEGFDKVHVVGSSLGGALSQYLAAYHSDRLLSATFGNTFVPNSDFYNLAAPQFKTLPYVPEATLMSVFRKGVEKQHYPASGNSEILRTYLLEQGYGKMSKSQFVSRAKCVLDIFDKRAPRNLPIFIIESENDQLVPDASRSALKNEYPQAKTYTFQGTAGHFSYVNRPDEYIAVLRKNINSEKHPF